MTVDSCYSENSDFRDCNYISDRIDRSNGSDSCYTSDSSDCCDSCKQQFFSITQFIIKNKNKT